MTGREWVSSWTQTRSSKRIDVSMLSTFVLCIGDSLIWHQQHGVLRSIDRVADEFRRGDDELSRWAIESLGESAFMRIKGQGQPTSDSRKSL
jgi:hypothetical protein